MATKSAATTATATAESTTPAAAALRCRGPGLRALLAGRGRSLACAASVSRGCRALRLLLDLVAIARVAQGAVAVGVACTVARIGLVGALPVRATWLACLAGPAAAYVAALIGTATPARAIGVRRAAARRRPVFSRAAMAGDGLPGAALHRLRCALTLRIA